MATGTRIRQDFIEGTLISNLSTSATAMESDGLSDLTVIDNAGTGNYAAAVIGDEVVHIITHNSAATTAEIQRGQEGTAAAAHDAGAAWHHGPTEDDWTEVSPSERALLSSADLDPVPGATTIGDGAWNTVYYALSYPAAGVGAAAGAVGEDMTGWNTADVHFFWAPTTANAGSVRWQMLVKGLADGATEGSAHDRTPTFTATASGTAGRIQKNSVIGTAWNAGTVDGALVTVRRLGDEAADDYPDAAELLSIVIVRAS